MLVKCVECGKQYDIERESNISDFQCECGGELIRKRVETTPTKSSTHIGNIPIVSGNKGNKTSDKSKKNKDLTKLMDCPDCGHQISVKAKSCPNCGHPVTHEERPKEVTKMTFGKFISINAVTFFVCCVIGVIFSLLFGAASYLGAAMLFLLIFFGTSIQLLKDSDSALIILLVGVIPFIILVYFFSWMGILYFILIWGVIFVIGHLIDYNKKRKKE